MSDRKLDEILTAYERGYERGQGDAFGRAAVMVDQVGQKLMARVGGDGRVPIGASFVAISAAFTALAAGFRDMAVPEPEMADDE